MNIENKQGYSMVVEYVRREEGTILQQSLMEGKGNLLVVIYENESKEKRTGIKGKKIGTYLMEEIEDRYYLGEQEIVMHIDYPERVLDREVMQKIVYGMM